MNKISVEVSDKDYENLRDIPDRIWKKWIGIIADSRAHHLNPGLWVTRRNGSCVMYAIDADGKLIIEYDEMGDDNG